MARKRDPRRDEAFEIWKQHEGKITNREISRQLDVPEKTISGWKSKDKWNGVLQSKIRSTPNKNKVVKKNKEPPKEPIIENDNLTDKQRLFCIYYIKYFNATKAYRKAYECDYATAMASGSRLLRNVKISREIDRLKAEQASELKLDVRDVLQKYIDIAFADITDYVSFGNRESPMRDQYGEILTDENGEQIMDTHSYVDLNESDEVDGTIITEVKQGRDGISVKLADKMKALEMLSKYFDLLSDNDKKRLQEEKLRMEINKLQNGDGSSSKESEVAAMLRRLAGEE